MSKRKLGSHSPTNMSPQKKKTRVVSTAKLHQWTAGNFKEMVYTPPTCSLPSPFGKDFKLDQPTMDNIARFGPHLQSNFNATCAAANTVFRKRIQKICDDEHIGWIDPMWPVGLTSGEGLSLSQQGQKGKTIRFKRVVSEYAIQWFAFVQKGTRLTVNGQSYPNTRDFVIGPFPSFSIVEYHERIAFVFLNRQSVDYVPGNLDYQPTVNRIIGSFSKEQDSKGKETAGSGSGENVVAKPSVRIEPEIQPDDTDPCEYFRWRIKEWKLLQQQSGDTLENPILPHPDPTRGQWLFDNQMFRAIASVTTAIGIENKMDFALIDEESYLLSRQYIVERELMTTGRNADLFLPYNTDDYLGVHWVLLHVKYEDFRPEIHVYNTQVSYTSPDAIIKKTVVNTSLYDDLFGASEDLTNIPIIHHATAQQPGGWECGYFTVLSAWCIALGMVPGVKPHRGAARVADMIDLINLSISGFMDSATIQAFLRCIGFVDPNHNTVASDRHFTRSVPFLPELAMGRYIRERRELERNPDSVIKRLDLDTIRLLLDSANPGALGDLDKLSLEVILQHFDRWLKERNLVDPTTPPSPTSPATIRLTFGIAQSLGPSEWTIPANIPDDTRVLRQIWDIYHDLLKKRGYLGQARQERANDLNNGGFSTREVANDDNYPYLDRTVVALTRLGMLPTTHTLTPAEREDVKKASKLRIKLTARK